MRWARASIKLACGCTRSVDPFDELWPGEDFRCPVHGRTKIVRWSRVSDARPKEVNGEDEDRMVQPVQGSLADPIDAHPAG